MNSEKELSILDSQVTAAYERIGYHKDKRSGTFTPMELETLMVGLGQLRALIVIAQSLHHIASILPQEPNLVVTIPVGLGMP